MNNVTYLPPTTSLSLQRLGGILLLMLVNQLAVAAAPNDCDPQRVEDYVAAFNKIDRQENVQVAKSFEVFERVNQVADNHGPGLFKLTVIDNKVARAMALSDNNVLLSKPAIDVIYGKEFPLPEIEARLAFVLGHELAHLAYQEEWAPHVFPKLTDNCGDNRPNYLEQESAADARGFMYAGMAGYQVDLLLQSSPDDFLTYWVKMVSPQKLNSLELKVRVASLKAKLQQVLDRLPFFYFGTRLAHFERCADGKEFLKQFHQAFPAREVWNNLGFCYLQEARRSMGNPWHSEFYWMPLTLDTESRAGSFTRSEEKISNRLGNMPNSHDTEGYLREAEFQFKRAVDSDKNYWPAKVNLAIVDLYLNTPNTARDLLNQAEPLVPASFKNELEALQSVAVYEQSEAGKDLWPNAEERLKKLIPPKSTTAPLSALYNLARLYQIRQRPAEEKTYWDLLVGRLQELPDPIAKVVCEQQKISFAKGCPTTSNVTNLVNTKDYPTFIQWPIPFEWNPLSGQASVQATLNGLKSIPVKLSSQASLQGKIYYTANQDEVLELGDYLQMQVVKGEWPLEKFRSECSRFLRPRQVPSGTLWSCGKWAALEKGGKVREVWGVLRLD